MGRPRGLAAEHRRALDQLKGVRGIKQFYLVGGTALTFHLAHRLSRDLDLFSLVPGIDLDELWVAIHKTIPGAELLDRSDVTLKVEINRVPVDFVSYPYSPSAPPTAGPEGIAIAGLIDLGAMKLAAIARRGIRRDFWDLYEILQSGVEWAAIREAYCRVFHATENGLYHVLRSLTWFGDAESSDEWPAGLTKKRWETIKRYFEEQAPRLLADT